MNFFTMAQEEPFHFNVEKKFSLKLKPMFEEDEGPEDIRATVHFYIMSHK
jgi:predicted nicotinamide N-methyase